MNGDITSSFITKSKPVPPFIPFSNSINLYQYLVPTSYPLILVTAQTPLFRPLIKQSSLLTLGFTLLIRRQGNSSNLLPTLDTFFSWIHEISVQKENHKVMELEWISEVLFSVLFPPRAHCKDWYIGNSFANHLYEVNQIKK